MNKVLWGISFLLFPYLSVAGNTSFDCPEVSINVTADNLEIRGLTAPIEIVKVFNAAYNLVYECNGNCPDEIELSNLSEGNYNIDIQSYNNNWRFICDQREKITIVKDGIPDCGNIDIKVEEDRLIVNNLNAPNKIIKVFDVFYNLIDLCYFNCGDEFIIPNFLTGNYRIDIQFYTADWQFICDRKEDFLIDLLEEPCDDSPCKGNIVLQSQREVDEFCGCKVVQGNLIIGKDQANNITSLSNLRDIEEIKGTLAIKNTKIQNFEGLGNLGKIGGDLELTRNNFLTSFQGLNNLVEIIGAFNVTDHNALEHLNGLDRWVKVKDASFTRNKKLTDLSKLTRLTELESLHVTKCEQLKNLPALTLISSLSGLTLRNNIRLENLEFLNAIEYLSGQVEIIGNTSLSDCCGLYRLIDEDTNFGNNDAVFNIFDNAFTCRSIPAILSDCQLNEPSCTDVKVSPLANKITISGLTAPNEIIKVFDANYRILYDCFGNCEEVIQLGDLTEGTYRIYSNFYNENWVPICETIAVVALDSSAVSFIERSGDSLPFNKTDFSLAPNPAVDITYIDLKPLHGVSVDLRLLNQFGQKIWEQHLPETTEIPQKIDLHTFQNGVYFLQIRGKGRGMVTKKLLVNRLY